METTLFKVGDTVKVFFKAQPTTRTRTTPFEGIVISLRGAGKDKTFTVRKVTSSKVAVERIFPLDSPAIEKVSVLKSSKVRRAKLYYLRKKQ